MLLPCFVIVSRLLILTKSGAETFIVSNLCLLLQGVEYPVCLSIYTQLFGFNFVQSLVPLGSVEELLAAYDSQRRELPPPVTVWEWGWTKSAETWNGRAAMLAVLVLLVLEVTTGEGFLHQWGILPLFR